MSRTKVWTKHYQADWEIRSGDPRLPQWFRVAALAYGMHRANGHACFKAGDIADILATPHRLTGELLADPNPGRAIRVAVEYGLLGKQSNTRCLVVPPHAVQGPIGNPRARCPIHGEVV